MTVIDRSIVVNAPVEEAARIGEDPNLRPQWYVGMETYKPGAGYPNAGTKSEWVMKSSGVTLNGKEEITAYDKNRLMSFKFDAGMIKGKMDWRYTPEGNGTRIDVHTEYEMGGGIVGKALNALVVERALIADHEKSLENLKALTENMAAK